MSGKRAKAIRKAVGLVPKIYRNVQDLARAEGVTHELYIEHNGTLHHSPDLPIKAYKFAKKRK